MSKILVPGWVSRSWGNVAMARRFALKDSRGTCCSGCPVEGSRASFAPKNKTNNLIGDVSGPPAEGGEDDEEDDRGRIRGRMDSALSVL